MTMNDAHSPTERLSVVVNLPSARGCPSVHALNPGVGSYVGEVRARKGGSSRRDPEDDNRPTGVQDRQMSAHGVCTACRLSGFGGGLA